MSSFYKYKKGIVIYDMLLFGANLRWTISKHKTYKSRNFPKTVNIPRASFSAWFASLRGAHNKIFSWEVSFTYI